MRKMKHPLLLLALLGFISTHPMNLLQDLKEKKEGLQYLYNNNRSELKLLGFVSSLGIPSIALISHNILPNIPVALGCGALSTAALLYVMGREGIYQKNKRQKENNYFFALAAQKGDLTMLESLYNAGAQVNAEIDFEVWNGPRKYELICPLYAALSKNQFDAANFLKSRGADVNIRVFSSKATLAMLLAHKENKISRLEVMKWLAREGADFYAKDAFGLSASISDYDRKMLLLEQRQRTQS